MMESSVSHCPVPREQQPVNEYEELKSAWLFRDCAASLRDYMTKIAWIFGITGFFAVPVAAASFPPHKHLAEFLLSGTAGASIGVVLILVRLYLGWIYVRDRLMSPVVFYEESGWYDGQTWKKTRTSFNTRSLNCFLPTSTNITPSPTYFFGLGGFICCWYNHLASFIKIKSFSATTQIIHDSGLEIATRG